MNNITSRCYIWIQTIFGFGCNIQMLYLDDSFRCCIKYKKKNKHDLRDKNNNRLKILESYAYFMIG